MTQEGFELAKLTLILKLNLLDQTPLIWMKTKKRCYKNAGQGLLILAVKKRRERLVKRNLKKQDGWLNFKSVGS